MHKSLKPIYRVQRQNRLLGHHNQVVLHIRIKVGLVHHDGRAMEFD